MVTICPKHIRLRNIEATLKRNTKTVALSGVMVTICTENSRSINKVYDCMLLYGFS